MTNYYPRSKYTGTTIVLFLKNSVILPMLLLGILVLSSCEEKTTSIGTDLLPESDNVNMEATDTVAVEAYTMYVDSVSSSNKSTAFLGGLYDPYFGSTFADFVSQLRLTQKWPGGTPFVDSVTLYMTISGATGVYNIDQGIKLYEITEQLNIDSVYYSNKVPQTSTYIGLFPLPDIKKDSAVSVSVRLPVWFGEYLLRDTTKLNQEGGVNDFRSFFKGLYITVERISKGSKGSLPDVPLLLSIPVSTGDFRIRVFYHTNITPILSYDFIINPNSARYNRYQHDFSTAEPGKGIQHINDGYKDTLSYLQGFYGVFTRVKIPEMESFKSLMPISVNKTKIYLSVFLDDNIYKSTTVPSRIYMSYVTKDGKTDIVPDYYVSPAFFDGTFSTSTKKYTFNLSAFTQEYLEGRILSPEIDLHFPEGEYKNVILKTNNSKLPVKFEFIYTRF